jgi:hypothetical protein
MACPLCGADPSLEARGLANHNRAASIADRSRTWVIARMNAGRLATLTVDRQRFVVLQSLERLLCAEGRPDLLEQADQLEEQGRKRDALYKREQYFERAQRENDEEMAALGYFPKPPITSVTRGASPLIFPWRCRTNNGWRRIATRRRRDQARLRKRHP